MKISDIEFQKELEKGSYKDLACGMLRGKKIVLSESQIEKGLTHHSVWCRANFVYNEALSVEQFKRALGDKEQVVRLSAATIRVPPLSQEELEVFFQKEKNSDIRRYLLKKIDKPKDEVILLLLLKDFSWMELQIVLKKEQVVLSESLLNRLVAYDCRDVDQRERVEYLEKYDNLPLSVIVRGIISSDTHLRDFCLQKRAEHDAKKLKQNAGLGESITSKKKFL